ncbi:unnamed protein product [Linum trigynum]|uniref:Uncharacterized protein n=1 Tax=Linum trigynum TaxID=586398 RepID=A0AAV2FXF3_9ROSI
MGGAGFHANRARPFRQCIQDCVLIDVDLLGPCFTWNQGNLFQLLDRTLYNQAWFLKFSSTAMRHLERLGSDHRPILVQRSRGDSKRGDRLFWFWAALLGHDNFMSTVTSAWAGDAALPGQLVALAEVVKKWNSEVLRNIMK